MDKLKEEEQKFVRSWSWGAAMLSWIWALASRLGGRAIIVFIVAAIPIVNILFFIWLGMDGREWSWKKGEWESFGEFKKRQRLLDNFGIVLLLGWLLFGALFLLNAAGTPEQASPQRTQCYEDAQQRFRNPEVLRKQLDNCDRLYAN